MENNIQTLFSVLEQNHLDFIDSLNLTNEIEINKCATKLLELFHQEEYGLAFKILNMIE